MEIIQVIRKEIINRINKRHLSAQAKNEFVSILSFLDTLESEKPMNSSEGLEEEIERYLHSSSNVRIRFGYGGWVDGMEVDDLRGIARHFAQWQKSQMIKEEGKHV